jgi:LPXTG-motif cell wall-anchored protein
MGAYVHKQGITTAAGSEIVITYTAMLNNGAIVNPSGSNDNTVKLEYSNNPLDPTDFGTITPPNTQVFVGAFSLKKTDKHGTGLGGDAAADRAQFQVATKAAPNMPLYFTVLNADEGSYKLADAQTSGTGRIAVLTVGKLGELKLSGLEGDYSLKESRAPKNYSGAFLPQFTVNVTTDLGGLTSTGSAIGNQYTDTVNSLVTLTAKDTWQLVQGTKDAAVVATTPITVWNVTSVTELPMTGAAGITLFAVLAVLTGGVALVFVLKSRNSRNTPIAV